MPENETSPYDIAQQIMLDQVFAPVFFQKLAQDYGYTPQSEAEAIRVLQIAQRLGAEDDRAKTASAGSSLVEHAHQMLDHAQGRDPQETAIKQASHAWAQNDQLRDAALLYQDAINQVMATA